jgi:hypothetical protein
MLSCHVDLGGNRSGFIHAGGAGAGVGVSAGARGDTRSWPTLPCKLCHELTDKGCGACRLPLFSSEHSAVGGHGCRSTPGAYSQDDADDGQVDEDASAGGASDAGAGAGNGDGAAGAARAAGGDGGGDGGGAQAMDADHEADGAAAAFASPGRT